MELWMGFHNILNPPRIKEKKSSEKNIKKSSENDQSTGHFQSFIIYFFRPPTLNLKNNPVNQLIKKTLALLFGSIKMDKIFASNIVIIFLSIETVLLRTYKICLGWEIRKSILITQSNIKAWPGGYKLFHAQLNMKFILLINVKMPTSTGRMNTASEIFKARNYSHVFSTF